MNSTMYSILCAKWLVICVVLSLNEPASSLRITHETRIASTVSKTGIVSISCHADEALTGCQFKVMKISISGPIIDFAIKKIHTEDSYTAEYDGKGLSSGDCSIKLSNITIYHQHYDALFVGCRVRGTTGGWLYGAGTSLQVDSKMTFTMVQLPNTTIKLGDKNVTFLCNAGLPIDFCKFVLPPNNKYTSNLSPTHPEESLFYPYYGAGWESGDCGMTVPEITEKNNGLMRCVMGKHNMFGTAFMTAIVAKLEPPVLTIKSRENTETGQQITAECTVEDVPPVPTITWLFGDKVIRSGQENDEEEDEEEDDQKKKKGDIWQWPWDIQTIGQTIKLTITPLDEKKFLTCRVKHVALDRVLEKRVNPFKSILEYESEIKDLVQRLAIIGQQDISHLIRQLNAARQTVSALATNQTDLQKKEKTLTENADADSNMITSLIVIIVLVFLAIIGVVIYAKITNKWCFVREGFANRM